MIRYDAAYTSEIPPFQASVAAFYTECDHIGQRIAY